MTGFNTYDYKSDGTMIFDFFVIAYDEAGEYLGAGYVPWDNLLRFE